MNILYCGDKNIKDGLIISILSLIKHIDEALNIYVITADIPELNIFPIESEFINYLDGIIKQTNKDSFIKKIIISEMFKKELPKSNMKTRFTPCCMLRLFTDQIEDLPSKILYLDNDVVCLNSPKDLYNVNLDNYEIAGVLDNYGKWFFRRKIFKFDYINTGVLLINFDNIKKTELFKKARAMCINKKMFMPDQSSLNKLAKDKLILDGKYNEQKAIKKDTVFRHFTTRIKIFPYFHAQKIKPWDIENLHNILKVYEIDDLLKEYERTKKSYEKSKIKN